MQPTLGIHIIVCNEEECLPRCLNSVKDIADEIIVVDTGSTDRTLEIAREFGAKICTMRWDDDFSSARNLALDHAETDWVLYVDADEIVAGGTENLPSFLLQQEVEAFWTRIENITGYHSEERVLHQTVRIFRNRKNYRFTGRIHEQIIPSILQHSSLTAIKEAPIHLIHYGYVPDVMQEKKKIQRNYHLLQLVLAESPDDPFHIYNMGVTYCQLGQLSEAARSFEQARMKVSSQASYRSTLIRDLAKVWLAIGAFQDVERLLREEIERYSDYSDLYHLLGEALYKQGRVQEAFSFFKLAGHLGPSPEKYVTEAGIGNFRTFHMMGDIAAEMGRLDEAEKWYIQSLEKNNRYEPALTGVADVWYRSGKSDKDIAHQLGLIILPAEDSGLTLFAKILAGVGAYGEALFSLKSIVSPNAESERLRCELLMQTGQFSEAHQRLHVLQSSISSELLARDLALCYWSEERALPYRFYANISEQYRSIYEMLDCWVTEGKKPEHIDSSQIECIVAIMDRAIEFRLFRIAGFLSVISDRLKLSLAKSLYHHGFILAAADRLLELMKEGAADTEARFFLAEILYDRNHFEQAVSLFEQIVAENPEYTKAKMGVAAAYLQLAGAMLEQGLQLHPSHPLLQGDMQRLDTAMRALNGLSWHTKWSGAQRRNLHAEPFDFSLHDC